MFESLCILAHAFGLGVRVILFPRACSTVTGTGTVTEVGDEKLNSQDFELFVAGIVAAATEVDVAVAANS